MATTERFGIDTSDYELFLQKCSAYKGNVEEKINSYLHNEGGQVLQKNITNFIPVWKGKHNSKYSPDHAKYSKWYDISTNFNLEVDVSNKSGSSWNNGSYYYLYFVNMGEGRASKSSGIDFMSRGGEVANPILVNGLFSALENVEF